MDSLEGISPDDFTSWDMTLPVPENIRIVQTVPNVAIVTRDLSITKLHDDKLALRSLRSPGCLDASITLGRILNTNHSTM